MEICSINRIKYPSLLSSLAPLQRYCNVIKVEETPVRYYRLDNLVAGRAHIMSLITDLHGAAQAPFSVATSFGEARFKLFHKNGARVRDSVVFVSHGFQCYPARTEEGTYRTYCFAYLIPENTSLSRTKYDPDWAVEAGRKFSDQPLAFATAGIIAAVVGAHGEPPDNNYNAVFEALLDHCDIALFDGMGFSEEKVQEHDRLLTELSGLTKLILAAQEPERQELKTRKQRILAYLALFDNNAIPLVELVGRGTFGRYSEYLMHCCRPAWPPAGGTTTHGIAKTPEGLFAYDDAFHAMID
jgi:hypothetical protein